jgi:glycosyltransferase involved in cell wall biosynthesis
MKPANADVTVGLVMIVKNESQALPRLAATLDGQLDHWTIVDTGSSDDTVALARELFSGVPGEVVEDEWRGFGPSRNVALAAARPHTEWLLFMDADETFHGTVERATPSDYQSVEVEIEFGELRFMLPRMVRSEDEWEWRGRTHEYLALKGREAKAFESKSFYIKHHGDGGSKGDKYERDVKLLQADLREFPDDARTVFYLARTYEDLGEYSRAATWYDKRTRLGGWEEELWYAKWRLGSCLLRSRKIDEACGVLMRAWGSRPWRAEPLWTLAEHYRTTEQWRLGFEVCQWARHHCFVDADPPGNGYNGDRLFVHKDVYQWRIAYEQSICAFYLEERPYGSSLIDELLKREDLPPYIMESVENNRKIYDQAD